MDTSEKAEPTASIHHIESFWKSGILLYNSEVPDTAGRRNEKKKEKKKDTYNCKVLCVLRKRNNNIYFVYFVLKFPFSNIFKSIEHCLLWHYIMVSINYVSR